MRPERAATQFGKLSGPLRLLPGIRGTVTPRQVASRLARTARYKLVYPYAGAQLFPQAQVLSIPHSASPALPWHEAGYGLEPSSLLAEADLLRRGQIAYLNLPPATLDQSSWTKAPQDDPLWLYNLHYGEWALTLARAYAESGDVGYRDTLTRLMSSWLDSCPAGAQPAWDPYPLARRLVAWSKVAAVMQSDQAWQPFWAERLEPSLRAQARMLKHNLEHDIPNNHLIADYRALAWVGLAFPGWPESRRLAGLGIEGFLSELRRQILPDGVHDERSISYHAVVLQDVLETWRLTKAARHEKAEEMGSHVEPMCRFLEGMRTPGNTWPMLNDTVPGYPCDPLELLAAAAVEADLPSSHASDTSTRRSRVFASAGYAVIADAKGNWAVFDAGPMGPDRVLGHGHADALSVEIHHDSSPLIVDPGVFTYREGEWRDRFRGTAAHNTAVVDGQDQCVFWGAFRVAYPPRARLLDWSLTHVRGEHCGYTRLPGAVVHTRRLELLTDGAWRVDDRFDGHGRHDLSIGFQLAEGAQLEVSGTSGRALWPGGQRLDISAVSAPDGATAKAEDGWIAPDWNVKHSAPRFVLRWRGLVPVDCALILRTGGVGEDRT
jgi:hypothetical protein